MMKKTIWIGMFLFLFGAIMQAQVKIGGNDSPAKGALLDLNGDYKGGLLLPNVAITDLGVIPVGFTERGGADTAEDLTGMIVWSTDPVNAGLYMWDGDNWQSLMCQGGQVTEPGSVTASSTTVCSGTPTTLSYTGGSGATFVWYSGSCGGTSVGTGNNLSVSPTATTVYYGRWESGSSYSDCKSVTVTVNTVPANPGNITFSPTSITVGGTTTATVATVDGASSYVWTLPEGLTPRTAETPGTTLVITGGTADTYTAGSITVRAKNSCGNSAGTGTTTAGLTVNKDPGTIDPAPTGSGPFSGKTCFDVAKTESGTECGTLASRLSQQADFSQASTYSQQYTFAPTGSVTNVSFAYVEDAASSGLVIENLSYSGNIATVTYKNMNAAATGKNRSNALKATIYVIFNVGTNQYQIPLVVSIMDCQCCPGYFAQGGEYAPGNTAQYLAIPDAITFATLTNAGGSWRFAKTGKDLCYYKTDANGSATMNWNTASPGCQSASTTYNDGTTGWRLPNIAELGAIQSIHTSLASQATSAAGTANLRTIGYWSSTEPSSDSAVRWHYGNSFTYWDTKTGSHYVRCVRSY